MASRASYAGAARFVPRDADLGALRDAADACRGCDLYERATQTVFGEGSSSARLMLVGEQPGDAEDTAGQPFVGPSGQLLDRALSQAGIDRSQAYVTNAVKHFRWSPRGKRRIHEKPTAAQSSASRPWLAAELAQVRPAVLVALGATAAASLFGRGFRLTSTAASCCSGRRGRVTSLVTGHRSTLLWRAFTPRRCCAPTSRRKTSRAWSRICGSQPAD